MAVKRRDASLYTLLIMLSWLDGDKGRCVGGGRGCTDRRWWLLSSAIVTEK